MTTQLGAAEIGEGGEEGAEDVGVANDQGAPAALAEARANTAALLAVLSSVGGAANTEDAARGALDAARGALGIAYGSFWFVDPDSGRLRCALESGDAGAELHAATMSTSFAKGAGMHGRAWAERAVVQVAETAAAGDCARSTLAARAGLRAAVCVPVVVGSEVVGTFDFFAHTPFTHDRAETLRGLGHAVSMTAARALQAEAHREAALDAQATARVVDAMVGAGSADDAARAALDAVRSAFGWAYGSYWALDQGRQAMRFRVESGEVNPEFREVTRAAQFAKGVGLSGRTWARRELQFVEDLGTVRDCVRAPVARRAGVRSGVCFPIIVNDAVIGTMDFFSTEALRPSPERLAALREVGSLVSSAVARIEAQIESRRRVVDVVSDQSRRLSAASEQLAHSSKQMSADADGGTRRVASVAAATTEVSANVQSVAASAEQMTASIREIAKSAAAASVVATAAVRAAETTNVTVGALGDASAQIGKVVKVITSIAQQTNLLALNATIEAARAGEAGKGFAVVANEVKELAKETARATEDISQKIEAIQGSTRGAIGAIGQITTIIQQISSLQSSIASAVEEQTVTTTEMSRSIGNAAQGAREIAQSLEGVAQSARSTSAAAAQSQAVSADVAHTAGELLRLVDQM